jgi:hypothetical protein
MDTEIRNPSGYCDHLYYPYECPTCKKAHEKKKSSELETLRAENAALRAEIKEWLCESCNTVLPGPPSPGADCVVCPFCRGFCGPRGMIQRWKLEKENAALKERAEKAEEKAVDDFVKRFFGWTVEHLGESKGYVTPRGSWFRANDDLFNGSGDIFDELFKLKKQRDEAVRVERERCAKIVDGHERMAVHVDMCLEKIAAAIRSGEEKANG